MFDGLFIVSLIGTCIHNIKEYFAPTVFADKWANKELYHKDVMDNVSIEQRMKNLENGKYKLAKQYPEPHKNLKTGKIIIENCLLYNNDLKEYGAVQTMEWVQQGKYNLNPKELEKERKRIESKFEHMYSLL